MNLIPPNTTSFVMYTNLCIDIVKFNKYLPIVKYEKYTNKELKNLDINTNHYLGLGSVVSKKFNNKKSGDSKCFLHGVSIKMLIEKDKLIDVKVAKTGNFQMSGVGNISRAYAFIRYLYGILIELEEWTKEQLFTYKFGNGLQCYIVNILTNITTEVNYKINIKKLSEYINEKTEFRTTTDRSVSSANTVNIKKEKKFYFHKIPTQMIDPEGNETMGEIEYEEFRKLFPNTSKKKKMHTFTAFATGKINFSSAGDEREKIFDEFMNILKNRKLFELKPESEKEEFIDSSFLD